MAASSPQQLTHLESLSRILRRVVQSTVDRNYVLAPVRPPARILKGEERGCDLLFCRRSRGRCEFEQYNVNYGSPVCFEGGFRYERLQHEARTRLTV
jgi:hypothetical protein